MWNEERFAAAVRYRDEGLSAREIANRIGGVTRNGVLGKFHRAGLATKALEPDTVRAKLQRRRQRARRELAKATKPAPVVVKPAPVVAKPVEPQALDLPRVLSLTEMDSQQCRWPVGEPTQGFCGCQAVEGKPYCPGHHARAFTAHRASIPAARINFQLRVSTVGNSTRWGS